MMGWIDGFGGWIDECGVVGWIGGCGGVDTG